MLNIGSIRSFVLHAVFLSSATVAMMVITPVSAGMLCGKSKVVESDQTVVAQLEELPVGKTETVPAGEVTDHSVSTPHSDAGSSSQ